MMGNTFNNREIATIIWLSIFLIWMLSVSTIRSALLRCIQGVYNKHIIGMLTLMCGYVYLCVMALKEIGIWDISLLKDTILWFCLSGLVLVLDSVTLADKDSPICRKILADNVKTIVILEFMVNFYSFSLPIELIFLPTMVFIVALGTVASEDSKNSSVAKLMGWTQRFIGYGLLIISFKNAIAHPNEIVGLAALKQFVLPIFLTLLFVPFIYCSVFYAAYESLFNRINFAFKSTTDLKYYARKRIFEECRFSVTRLRTLSKEISPAVWSMQSQSDIDLFFDRRKST